MRGDDEGRGPAVGNRKIFALLVLCLFAAYPIYEQRTSTLERNRIGEPPFDTARPDAYLAAARLAEMTSQDTEDLAARYANRMIGVSGRVTALEEGFRNDLHLLLDAGPGRSALRLELEPDSRDPARASAKTGHLARLGCRVIGHNGQHSYLNQCTYYFAAAD